MNGQPMPSVTWVDEWDGRSVEDVWKDAKRSLVEREAAARRLIVTYAPALVVLRDRLRAALYMEPTACVLPSTLRDQFNELLPLPGEGPDMFFGMPIQWSDEGKYGLFLGLDVPGKVCDL